MDNGLNSFKNIRINKNFLDEIWKFDPLTLGSLDNITVSQYSIALAQYLIFYKSETNVTRAEIAKKKRLFDVSLSLSMTPETLKKFKTKTAALEYLVSTVPDLTALDEEINSLQEGLILLDGIDKSISEYIATFKRELTRREQELFTIRAERRL